VKWLSVSFCTGERYTGEKELREEESIFLCEKALVM